MLLYRQFFLAILTYYLLDIRSLAAYVDCCYFTAYDNVLIAIYIIWLMYNTNPYEIFEYSYIYSI